MAHRVGLVELLTLLAREAAGMPTAARGGARPVGSRRQVPHTEGAGHRHPNATVTENGLTSQHRSLAAVEGRGAIVCQQA